MFKNMNFVLEIYNQSSFFDFFMRRIKVLKNDYWGGYELAIKTKGMSGIPRVNRFLVKLTALNK